MGTYQIECITKLGDHYDPHERITRVGGTNPSGTRWNQSQEQTIGEIESGTDSFYVLEKGLRSEVIVASRNGRKYLRTTTDYQDPNNLLALPECD